ncbi:MAG: hypothetical protein ABSC19_04985 [Syntrophorhabdales bacterium]|jgi:hypothetical protein
MPIRNLDSNPDGWDLGQSATDKIGFYGSPPVPQRTNPYQNPIQGLQMGEVVTFFATLSPAAVAANTTAEQTFTVTGITTTDFVWAVNKPSVQAGLGIVNWRISAANTLAITFSNNTGSSITPTASEVYIVTVLRGFPIISPTLNPAAVPADTSAEQQFVLAPTPPVAQAIINAQGQVTGVTITSQGAGYIVPPTVVFAGGGPQPSYPQSGTFAGLDAPPATAAAPYGQGATGVAILNGAGNVVALQITNPGQGYQAAPQITFVGGLGIAGGMALAVSKPSAQAGLGIGGCRVVSNNVIGITYVNNTGSAITPASEAYGIVALNEVPAIGKMFIANINVGTAASVAATTTAEGTYNLNGLLTTDRIVGVSKPSLQAGLIAPTGRVGAAGSLRVTYANVTGSSITPTANEIYSVEIVRAIPQLPLQYIMAQLSPASIAANTTAEQTFTVNGVTFINSLGGSLSVNKPTSQPGLAIVNCRVSAANTVAVTFQNNSGVAITPTAGEWYAFMSGDQVPTGTEAASYTPFVQEAAGFMF